MNEKVLYNGFHRIVEVVSKIKNKTVTREKLIIKHAVGGIVMDETDKIALVSQYRPVIGRMTQEIPAGILDKPGLTPIEVLVEELFEECEIPKEDILEISPQPVHDYYMIVGSADAKISLFTVRVKKQENKRVQDADVESVEWVTLPTLERLVQNGIIQDPKTIIAYYYLKNIF